MRRAIAAVGCGLAVLVGVGCQTFSHVQKDANGGVIELKASDREAALAKLKAQEGDIVIENEVVKGKPGMPFDPNTPVQASDRMTASTSSGFGSMFASKDDEKVQIKYTKKPMGTATGGLPLAPKDDGVAQAGFRTNSAYDRSPGMATVGGQKSNTALPKVDMTGFIGGK